MTYEANAPLISIIIPVYNAEKYLAECLVSVINQTYQNLEVILINDGSNDSSLQIAQAFQQKDARLKVISQDNAGVAAARNRGLRSVTGAFISFVDSDDWISPDHLESLYRTIEQHSVDIAVCDISLRFDDKPSEIYGKSGKEGECWEQPRIFAEMIFDQQFSNHLHNKLFRAELWEGISFVEGHVYEDLWIMPQVVLRTRKVAFTGKATMNYRQHESSITHVMSARHIMDYYLANEVRWKSIQLLPQIESKKWLSNLYVYPKKTMIVAFQRFMKTPHTQEEEALMLSKMQDNHIRVKKLSPLHGLALSVVKRWLEFRIRRKL